MTTFTNKAKNSTSLANKALNSTTFTNKAKTALESFLLMENGSYLLLETGDRIILEQSSGSSVLTMTNKTKN